MLKPRKIPFRAVVPGMETTDKKSECSDDIVLEPNDDMEVSDDADNMSAPLGPPRKAKKMKKKTKSKATATSEKTSKSKKSTKSKKKASKNSTAETTKPKKKAKKSKKKKKVVISPEQVCTVLFLSYHSYCPHSSFHIRFYCSWSRFEC